MIWGLVLVLAVAAFLAAAFLLRAPRSGWEAIGAALLLGIAGYALQGRPGLNAAPKQPVENSDAGATAMVQARQQLGGEAGVSGNRWIVIADALARHGQYADAAGVLQGAVEQEPNNAEAWLALANALVGHADGQLTPAALYAYRHAAQAAPEHPGPGFFLGLALAQSGRLAEARRVWADLLAGSPPDAPWRADLAERLVQLDAFLARNGGGQ